MPTNLPACLIIMDGFGVADAGVENAISLAHTPNIDTLFGRFPTTTLCASGLAVGLPEGQMGNSEVGHLNIGAGRVVYQELTRIDKAVEDGSIRKNRPLSEGIDAAVSQGRAVHLMGLVSDGGVHSHITHLFALLEMVVERGAQEIRVHCFLDGRDVSPTSGAGFVEQVENKLVSLGRGSVATVMGRYYAMDRDRRWDRVERAWRAMVLCEGERNECGSRAVAESYARGATDEFVEPVIVVAGDAKPVSIEDGDAVLFFNFRPDRAREITRAFVDPTFAEFSRPVFPRVHFVCLTEYDPTIPAPVAFPKELPTRVLADVLAEQGLRQLHIAETEKYAHVTFFLNGGSEPPKPLEERMLVPSPRIATYDLEPQMSAPEVTAKLLEAIQSDRADVYIVNYANCDMVGHTGVMDAAVKAVEAVDAGVGTVVEEVRRRGGAAIVTADHGNAERMVDADGSAFTAHTAADVPLCVVADGVKRLKDGGILADVAPTLLALLGIDRPPEWTGSSLLLY
ncbi:MAG: 2,3-bisphosphoglycerate-independent phosphoglycerate mutase [Coriobacteriia bacterium]|nr:2,3-bisphosphoglycerate-independent phosphoglycerate mutase [Coriobacteriia bacterium]